MESKEKGKEREEKRILMAKKLKRGVLVGKRGGGGGPSTPPPRWRLKDPNNVDDSSDNVNQIKNKNKNKNKNKSRNKNKNRNRNRDKLLPFTEFLNFQTSPTVSARKLCANLWEFESHRNPLPRMPIRPPKPNLHRRPLQNAHGYANHQDDEPATASSLGRTYPASLIQYRRSLDRNDRNNRDDHADALQPLSPASYAGSSMEVGPYKHAVTPASSMDLRVRMGGSSYSLKTSTELLKLLNRIWSLEEQHASNVSLVKAMKMELDHSRARIKELLHEQQSNRQEMEELMKQVTDEKMFRKTIEQDRVRAAVQSVHDELEDERKLRKRSEGLHRKLAREHTELKSSFTNVLRELERERKAQILLENLCDEFARGISDYEQEVRSLKHKPEKDRGGVDKHDRLILHISEAWLDERMQMKLAEAENNIAEKITIVDKLGFDIATFLQAKQAVELRKCGNLSPKERCLRRHSLESFPLNEAGSAPRHLADEDSTDVDSHRLEASKRDGNKQSKSSDGQHGNGVKSNSARKKVKSQELIKGGGLSDFQGQFEERMTRAMSCTGDRSEFVDKNHGGMERENLDATEDLGIYGLTSKHVLDNLIRNHSLSAEDSCKQSLLTSSPVQKWKSELLAPEFEKSESSSRWPQDLDENSLMAQLIEARLERRRRSRSKPTKGSF